jgi:hypothetical protein
LTLTTKKSRRIEIDGVSYRYQVSTTRIDDNWNFTLNLTVQNETDAGSVLQTKGLVTRGFWLDFSDIGGGWDKGDYPVIFPKHIASFVKLALSNGWTPSKNGKPFVLNVDNEQLLR